VVPTLYRQHFPTDLKAHRAHDVLLLCFRCLEKVSREADKYKAVITKRYNIPLTECNPANEAKKFIENLKKLIISYVKHKDLMPPEKMKSLKDEIRKTIASTISDPMYKDEFRDDLKKLNSEENGRIIFDEKFVDFFSNLKKSKTFVNKTSNKDFRNGQGKLVVEQLKTNDDLKDFIEEWRFFFLETMDPQFLPNDWNAALEAKAKLKLLKQSQLKENTNKVKEDMIISEQS